MVRCGVVRYIAVASAHYETATIAGAVNYVVVAGTSRDGVV